MILGLGNDVVQIPRIAKLYDEYGDKFTARWFHPQEVESINKVDNVHYDRLVRYYAKRFAAKEAYSKALGTGFRDVVTMQNIAVLNDNLGKPYMKLEPELTAYMTKLIGFPNVSIHLSMSDDDPVAFATVVLSVNQ